MRNSFINRFTAIIFIAVATVAFAVAQPKKQLGIATYSVKGLESDVEGSLKSLANDGYVVMEISNYNTNSGQVAGYSPADYAALAEKYGLDILSSHTRAKFDVKDPEGTLAAWGKVFDDHKIMGCKYVVLPSNTWSTTVEGLKADCDLMNKIGEEANKRGLKFGYHNHSQEFAKIAGTDQILEDFLIANTDPSKVFFQMDVYWITMGGQDAVAYLKKYPTRFQVLHIKDEYIIGESGKLDFAGIFNQFYSLGHQDWFVEIEAPMTPEQRAQMAARTQQQNQGQGTPAQGAPAPGAPAQAQGNARPQGAPAQAQGNPPAQAQGAPAQGAQNAQAQRPAQGAAPAGGFGGQQQDPAQQAERLKTSLDAISKSAVYLKNASFVK